LAYDIDFMVMRLVVLSLVETSADQITQQIFQMTSAPERQTLIEEYRDCMAKRRGCESPLDLGMTVSPAKVGVSR
jgi:hypothetical protein